MPAINVNPIRPAAWGPRDFPSSGGMNPPGIKVLLRKTLGSEIDPAYCRSSGPFSRTLMRNRFSPATAWSISMA